MYEHVYETVDIEGNAEIRANATAKVVYAMIYLIYCHYHSNNVGLGLIRKDRQISVIHHVSILKQSSLFLA